MNARKIKTLEDLDKAIIRKKAKVEALEKQIDDNFDHLQRNYASIVRNSIFKINIGGDSFAGTILGSIVGNEKVQQTVGSLVNKWGGKFADWMDRFTDKMSKQAE